MQRVRYQSGGDPLESWQVYDLVKKKLLASFKNRNYESKRAFFKDWGEDNLKNIIAESLEKTNPELLKCTRYIWLKSP